MKYTKEETALTIRSTILALFSIWALRVLPILPTSLQTSVAGGMMSCNGIFFTGAHFFNDLVTNLIMLSIALLGFGMLAAYAIMNARAKKKSEHLLKFDDLTGIYNKNGFYKCAQSLLQSNKDTKYCVAALDIYRFKIINEIFGRKFGDEILKEIAQSIKEEFEGEGVFCRFGSDIFMLCIPFEFHYIEKLQRINDKVENKLKTAGDIVLSIGVYVIENLDMPVATMCDRAYMASKNIKGSYTTRFAMYDDNLRATLLEERELTAHMKEGLENGEFQVYLQPKYSLDTERIMGSEALIRWFHPKKGLITPGKFIPIFERNGLIFNLDIFVLETVCKILRNWKEQGKTLSPIAINISRRNILQNHIAETIKDVVDAYGLDTSLVNLEITETAYIDNPDLLNKVIEKLRTYGFVISIDDFGSGYSSLNTLKDVPVDILKIDLKFLLNFDKESKGASILSSVVRMAKSLNMVIVAEGVETKEQASFLRSLGCGFAQGYYYSKPITVKQFEELVERQENEDIINEERDFITELDIENFWENNADVNIFLRNVLGGFGIYEIKDGTINASRVNDAYFELLGCSRDTYYKCNKNVIDWVYPSDRGMMTSAFLKTLETRKPEDVIYRRLTPDGKIIWLKSKFCFIAGNSVHSLYYAYFTDITNQIKTEKSLRANEKKYAMIMDHINDMVFEWHKKTDEVFVSEQFKHLFGYSKSVYLQFTKNFFKTSFFHEEDKEKLHSAFLSVYYGEQKAEVSCRIKYANKDAYRKCEVTLIRVENEFSDDLIIIGIATLNQ
ncbi:MAG: EAL domain-containing protein [Clostridia bacterium]|nr:EAL domain-containing protein [Clostridia bacterium]